MFVSISQALLGKGVSGKECCEFVVNKLNCGKFGGKADLANASFALVEDAVNLPAIKLAVSEYFKSKGVATN